MKILVGLGNPGPTYALTRHNVGFLCLDALAQNYDFEPFKEKFQGFLASGLIAGEKVVLFKPQTYMNRSGEPTQKLLAFYQVKPDNMFVFHDDLDLAPGKIRVKLGGGAGGHNGLKSLDQHMGPNYWRVRVGIGRPEGAYPTPTDYVLGRFAPEDEGWLVDVLQGISSDIAVLLSEDPKKFGEMMNNKG